MTIQGRPWWTLRGLLFAIAMLCVPSLCRAQSGCPWLNRATASGVLGGDSVMSVDSSRPGTISCSFLYQSGNDRFELAIRVVEMGAPKSEFATYRGRCGGQFTEVSAIGNEAIVCHLGGQHGANGQQVIGRVRDRAFIVTLSTTAPAGMGPDVLEERVRMIAEQVAGSLF